MIDPDFTHVCQDEPRHVHLRTAGGLDLTIDLQRDDSVTIVASTEPGRSLIRSVPTSRPGWYAITLSATDYR